ncbi:MAG: CBS domain-containing protein [Actinomycetota bacterium]|nr:CBS domain-containing protein [Actinomycetota bacterium]
MVRPAVVVFRGHPDLKDALNMLKNAGLPGAPVTDDNGIYAGAVTTSRLEEMVSAGGGGRFDAAVDTTAAPLTVSAKVELALEILFQSGMAWVPVIEENRSLAGVLSVSDLVRGYNQALDSRSGYAYNLTANALALETRVGKGSLVAGHKVRDAGLPSGCVLVWLQHNGVRTNVQGSTEIHEGDLVSAIVAADQAREFRRMMRAGVATSGPAD